MSNNTVANTGNLTASQVDILIREFLYDVIDGAIPRIDPLAMMRAYNSLAEVDKKNVRHTCYCSLGRVAKAFFKLPHVEEGVVTDEEKALLKGLK
jgi:hypothetical protein